jgi:hypothetical protein
MVVVEDMPCVPHLLTILVGNMGTRHARALFIQHFSIDCNPFLDGSKKPYVEIPISTRQLGRDPPLIIIRDTLGQSLLIGNEAASPGR